MKETQLLVQVKHHRGSSDAWGAEQLVEIHRQRDDQWADYDLVLVTAGSASEDLAEKAHHYQITLLDGEALATWIADSHASLSPTMKHALGISTLPARYSPVPGRSLPQGSG